MPKSKLMKSSMFRKIHSHILPFFVAFSIFIIIANLLTGCGTSPGNTDSGTADNNESNIIGSAGGTVTSSDGKVKIVIPSGSLNKDTEITFSAASNEPSGNIGTAYEVNPDGTTFNKPVTISIIYDEASLPAGVTESDIKLGTVTNNQWDVITDSFVNTTSNTISGSITHLSTYGIMAVNIGSVPAVPTGIAATAGDGKVTISWDAVSGATSYNIYWSTSSGVTKTTGAKIADVTTPYTHTGRNNGTTYYYVVTAVNDNGESGESSEVTVTPQAPIHLPKTGQTTCYDSSGTVIACAGTGQDGDLQSGVAWPNQRFTDNGDSTVTDNLTGLVWTKDGFTPGPAACDPADAKKWHDALDYVDCLNANSYLGYTDWRLPNINELKSLPHDGQSDTATWLNAQGFNNVQSNRYWSSTSTPYLSSNLNSAYAWFVNMCCGHMSSQYKFYDLYADMSYYNYVWPVRSGQSGLFGSSIIQIPKTGQTTCYDSTGNATTCAGTGQDGDLQRGVAWPNPRFTDNGDNTVTDKLTGLVWTKDGNAPGPVACSPPPFFKTWQAALDYVDCLNVNSFLGYTDWRLPNINELKSLLLHAGQSNTTKWLNSQGFNNLQDKYWSSTSAASSPDVALIGYLRGDTKVGLDKSKLTSVRPVRSGQ